MGCSIYVLRNQAEARRVWSGSAADCSGAELSTEGENQMSYRTGAALFLIGAIAVSSTGCRVENHRNGESENVRIATPFGGMSVKTNDDVAPGSLGIDLYPGALLEQKKKGNDGAADVNMSFGSFHLGVKAATYLTSDSADNVTSFYRKSLGKFGTVITCSGKRPVGTPTRTDAGLTCNDDSNKHSIGIDAHAGTNNDLELKTGSKQHQHIVSIEARGNETKIGLVTLDLPGNFDVENGEDKQ
jgi:hypothetical protein